MLGYLHYLMCKWFYWFIFYSCPCVIDINLKKIHAWNLFKRQLNLDDNEVFYKNLKEYFSFTCINWKYAIIWSLKIYSKSKFNHLSLRTLSWCKNGELYIYLFKKTCLLKYLFNDLNMIIKRFINQKSLLLS